MDRNSPPSYDHALASEKLPSHTTLYEYYAPTETYRARDIPPQPRYFVKADKEPSTLKLLTGPILTNATGPSDDSAANKARYRIIWPKGYEDVYLHKSTWSSHLPEWHVELLGRDRYEPEPLVLLGPMTYSPSQDAEHARDVAAQHYKDVVQRVQSEVDGCTRMVAFANSEFKSWDWRVKSAAAKDDMRGILHNARMQHAKCAELVKRLDEYLFWIKRKDDRDCEDVLRKLRWSIKKGGNRLKRLDL
jgi:hypothetical protein